MPYYIKIANAYCVIGVFTEAFLVAGMLFFPEIAKIVGFSFIAAGIPVSLYTLVCYLWTIAHA